MRVNPVYFCLQPNKLNKLMCLYSIITHKAITLSLQLFGNRCRLSICCIYIKHAAEYHQFLSDQNEHTENHNLSSSATFCAVLSDLKSICEECLWSNLWAQAASRPRAQLNLLHFCRFVFFASHSPLSHIKADRAKIVPRQFPSVPVLSCSNNFAGV